MSKDDITAKEWLQNKKRYADLFNGIIFDSRQIIKPEDLQQLDSESHLSFKSKSGRTEYLQRHRDIIMRWHNRIDLVLLACENQANVNYSMPVRTMIYDGLSYTDQMRNIWNSLSKEEQKNLRTEEIFSRFRKEDTLCPVITLVLYYGSDEWDGSVDLYEMFQIEDATIKQALEQFVPNYRINLINVEHITEYTHFQTDLQIVFGLMKYRKKKRELKNYIDSHQSYFSNMDLESRNALSVFLDSKKLLNNCKPTKTGGFNMCKAINDLIEEGIELGKSEGIELGRNEGIELGRNEGIEKMIILLRRQNESDERIVKQIADLYEISEVKVQAILRKMAVH